MIITITLIYQFYFFYNLMYLDNLVDLIYLFLVLFPISVSFGSLFIQGFNQDAKFFQKENWGIARSYFIV